MTPDAAAPAVTTRAARGAGAVRIRLVDEWLGGAYVVTGILAMAVLFLDTTQRNNGFHSMVDGVDAHNYWTAWAGGLYHGTRLIYDTGVYLYSPAFAQAFHMLTLVDWPIARALWAVPAAAAFAWLLRPVLPRYLFVLAPMAMASVATGNIEWMLCLVLVFGLRYPALWVIALLTKVTPGVGLLWFAARREWRRLAVALSATLAVVGVSFVIAPGLWFDWVDLLARNATTPLRYEGVVGFLPVRLAAAAVIVWVGARRNQPAALVFSAILAMPDINFTTGALMCALPRIADRRSA